MTIGRLWYPVFMGAVVVSVLLALALKAVPKEAPKVAPNSAKLQALIDGARKEGRLRLVWAETNSGGGRAVERWITGFNKLYGLDVKIQFTPGDDPNKSSARLLQEYRANQPAFTDVFWGHESHIASVAFAGVEALDPVDWTNWAPNITPQVVAPSGVAVEIATDIPSIEYNSKKITGDMVPKSMKDLLKPQYKGRIASTPYAANFDRLAASDLWGEQQTVEYVTKLSKQIAGLIRCGETERIVSGEFDIFALDCGNYEALRWKAQGAPIDVVIPTDAPLVTTIYFGVPKNALHPNAAKLWVNYILSREAQDIMYETSREDHSFIEGSKSAANLRKLEAAGVKFTKVDVQFIQKHNAKELGRISRMLQDILAKR